MEKIIGLSVLKYFYNKIMLQIKEKTTFEVDFEGNLMPKENPFATADWDVDSDNNLMPNVKE